MTDPSELAVTLRALAAALDAAGVTWAIGGSLASAAHGEPRATNDVDVVALLDERSARAVVADLVPIFYADVEVAIDAVRRRRSFNAIDQRSFVKAVIFVPAPGPLGAGQLARRRAMQLIEGVAPLPVLGAEDIVLQKLRWYREGGAVSDRQWRDLVSVLGNLGPRADNAYLDAVAGPPGLAALLARARSAAVP
jgi:hypothetical protein